MYLLLVGGQWNIKVFNIELVFNFPSVEKKIQAFLKELKLNLYHCFQFSFQASKLTMRKTGKEGG